jgi:mono/diheme cytochrome c family protein
MGKGMVIGLNAVTHVVISHGFAIGWVTMITIARMMALRKNSVEWDNLGYSAIVPAAVIISSVGAITGFGIFVTIGVLAPRASGSMVRIFFPPWFIESWVFVAESILLIILYLSWHRLGGTRGGTRKHILLGWIYFCLGMASAFLITGIIGYMLTPDGWPWTHSLADGWFNPSLVPQALLRIFGGLSLGALFMLLWVSFRTMNLEVKRAALRLYGAILLICGTATAGFTYWYFTKVPLTYKTHAVFAILTSKLSQSPAIFTAINWFFFAMLILLILVALIGSRLGAKLLIIPALISAIALTAEFERMREFVRGPFLMPGYMLASQVLLKEMPFLSENGNLAHTYWFNAAYPDPDFIQKGQALFGNNCATCHTIGGLNDIRDRVNGRPEDAVYVILGHTNDIVPFMPPFAGTDAERRVMAKYLYTLAREKNPIIPFRYPQHREASR